MSCLLAVCLSLGITANSYETLEPSYAYHFKAGNTEYIWAAYEDQTSRILGQGLSNLSMVSAGVGFKYEIDSFRVFFEAGYAMIDTTDKPNVRDEIIWTRLVNDHGGVGRPIPASDPLKRWDGNDSNTSYELESGFIGRVGVGYRHDNLVFTAAYRFLRVKEHIELWSDSKRDQCGRWWQETYGRDLSAFELGISYEF